MKHSLLIGIAAMVFFLLGDGVRMIYTADTLYKTFEPFIFIFIYSAISLALSLSTSLLHCRHKNTDRPRRDQHRDLIKLYALINISTLSSWASGYYAIKFLLPSSFSAIAVSTGPIILAFQNYRHANPVKKIAALTLLITALSLTCSEASLFNIREFLPFSLVVGVTLSVICGASIFANSIISNKLHNLSQPALKINAARSILAFFVSAALCITEDSGPIIINNLSQLVIFCSTFMLSTQWALQLSIKHLGAHQATLGISAAPLVAMFAHIVFFNKNIDSFLLTALSLNFVALILMVYIESKSPPHCL